MNESYIGPYKKDDPKKKKKSTEKLDTTMTPTEVIREKTNPASSEYWDRIEREKMMDSKMKKYADGTMSVSTDPSEMTDPVDELIKQTKAFAPTMRGKDPSDLYAPLSPETMTKVRGFGSQLNQMSDDELREVMKKYQAKALTNAQKRSNAGKNAFGATETVDEGLAQLTMAEIKRRMAAK